MKPYIFKAIIQIWNLCPFKKDLIPCINVFPKIKTKLYKDLRYKGVMTFSIHSRKLKIYNPGYTTIENELFWNGISGWEPISLNVWKTVSINSNVILDIGANSGIYSLIASITNPKAEVFAFEPVHRTIKLFEQNLILNPELNIKLVKKAVSNLTGSCTFYDLPTESQYSASLNSQMLSQYSSRIEYHVDTVALDTFNDLEGKKIDLIKLDVEMHEPEALDGMRNLIVKNRPILLIEILTDEIANKIGTYFNALNYRYFNINEIDPPKEVQNLTISDYYNFLIVPEEKFDDISHLI